jgi:hypothetical protein
MSGNTHTFRYQALAAAAMLVGASLARPGVTAAQAVTPEQVLMNPGPAASNVPGHLRETIYLPVDPSVAQVTAERALLGRTPPQIGRIEFDLETASVPLPTPAIDGAEALLGRREWVAVPR